MAGPFDEPPFSVMQCSPVRLEPKKVPGEYRFIHNLSHPFGDPASVNYNIPQVERSVAYSTLDDALGVVVGIGGGAFLAKTDIKSAYKIIPIHPLDYHLLGFRWGGKYYYAKTLPMGAASSCAIFERLSMALQFLAFRGVGVFSCIHVLDDFLFIAPSRDQCGRDLQMFAGMCEFAGVPIAHEKTEGPSQVLDFLGITIDVPMGLSRLPRDKVDRCRGLVEDFLVCQKVTLGQLQQLLGLLNFACRAVVPGRPFLATLYSLTKGIRRQCYKVRLTRAAKEDLAIWSTFLTDFNCCSFFLEGTVHSRVDVGLYTDASPTVGFGVCCGSEWVCGRWSGVWLGKGILVLETYAVLLAMAVWGPQLANRSILMHVDNLALVQILNKRYAEVVPLVRVLFLLGLRYNIVLAAQHVPGVLNVAADALSRFDFQAFRTSSPRAAFLPRRVPAWIRPEVFDPWTQPIASFPW